MNIKTLLLAFTTLFLGFSSFGQTKNKMTPLEYNNYLTDVTDSLYEYGTNWGSKFSSIVNEKSPDYSQLKVPRRKISSFITKKKEEILNKPPVGIGGEGLKQSMLSFLDYEMDMVEKAFIPFEDLESSINDEELQKLITKLTDQSAGEGAVLKMVNAAQEAFAKQNDFTIEASKE